MASITKRGEYWQAKVYYYDIDHARHSRSKSGFRTKKEATIWATEKENELKQYTEGFYLVSPSTLLAVAKPMRLASFFKRFRQKPELNYYHFTTISLKE